MVIPPDLRAILAEHLRTWQPNHVDVLCSGSMALERTAWTVLDGKVQLHANDVALYPSVLGRYLAGDEPMPITIRREHRRTWGWLAGYLKDPPSTVATILLCEQMMAGLTTDNAYFHRLHAGYRSTWPSLHKRTLDRVNGFTMRLASYTARDAFDVPLPKRGRRVVLCAPPLLTAARNYRPNAALGLVFDWPAPPFQELDKERQQLLVHRITSHHPAWLLVSGERLDDLDDQLHGLVQSSSRGQALYVYTSGGRDRLRLPRQTLTPVAVPRLRDQEVGDRLAIAMLTWQQFAALRSQYLDPKIPPASPQIACAVMVDGVLVGAFAYNDGTNESTADLYLLSDFAIRPTAYPRLSKLVVYAALSREAQLLIQRGVGRRVRTVETTAFSKRPSSMKYRGLLRVTNRQEVADGHQLQYAGEIGQWTLAEGLEAWKAKHAVREDHDPRRAGRTGQPASA